MGWDSRHISISAAVSRHNSERDKRDDALWEELVREVTEIVNQPRFEPIIAMVN